MALSDVVDADSVVKLNLDQFIIDKLIDSGFTSISQIQKNLEDDANETISCISGIGPARFEKIKKAAMVYKPIKPVSSKKNNKKKKEVTHKSKMKTTRIQVQLQHRKKQINSYDIADMMLSMVKNAVLDPNVPIYEAKKYCKYPSYDLFYDSEFFYVKFEFINDMLKDKLKDYEILSVDNIENYKDTPIHIAVNCLTEDSPLYLTVLNGRSYAYSNYIWLLGVDHKYIKIYRERLESKFGGPIEPTISEKLINEYNEFIKNEEREREGLDDDAPGNWDKFYKELVEEAEVKRRYDNAAEICLNYANTYIETHRTFKNLEDDVLTKLISYVPKIKDKRKLKPNVRIIIDNIKRDKKPKPAEDEGERTLEQVLDKDFEGLSEDLRNELKIEILEEVNRCGFNVFINGCKKIGDTCILMFTLVTKLGSDEDKYNFDTTNNVGTYQFSVDDIDNGILSIKSDLSIDKIKAKVIAEFKMF